MAAFPEVEIKPFLLEDMILVIDGHDYAASTSTAEFVPSVTLNKWRGLKKTSRHTTVTVDWACNLSYAQDWLTDDSLAQYLHEHQGEVIEDCILKPQSGVGPSFSADLTIVPGSIGGATDSTAVATVTLGSSAPVLVPAV